MYELNQMFEAVWFTRLCQLFAGSILILAGVSKVLRPAPFVEALKSYNLVPEGLFIPLAVSLPVLETMVGCGVWVWPSSYPIAISASFLFLVFGLAMAINLVRGRKNVPCGCGVFKKGTIGWPLVFRNFGFAIMVLGPTEFGSKIFTWGLTATGSALFFSILLARRKETSGNEIVGEPSRT